MIVSLDHDRSWEEGIRSGETTVLVIDAETRHVSPDQAYRKVFAVAKDAREAGIPIFTRKRIQRFGETLAVSWRPPTARPVNHS